MKKVYIEHFLLSNSIKMPISELDDMGMYCVLQVRFFSWAWLPHSIFVWASASLESTAQVSQTRII